MNCEAARQLLLESSLDQTDWREAAEALRHVEGCGQCQAALQDYGQLRSLLRRPQEQPEPAGGWAAFEQRMMDGISETPRPTARTGWPWLRWAGALAACLLVGVIGFVLGRGAWIGRGATTDVAVASAGFTEHEIAQQVQAFEQISKYFDHRTSWLLTSNGDSDMGLGTEPLADAGGKVVLLRLTLMQGGAVASVADLVIVPGQAASVNLPLKRGGAMHYAVSTSAASQGRITIWAEMQKSAGETLGALASNLDLRTGQDISAGRLVTPAGAFELKVAYSQASLPGGGT